MAYQQSSVSAYRQTSVKTASQGRIIVMLYDEALRQIDAAETLLAESSRELDKINNALVKAQDIVTELMVSLDLEQGGEIARNLLRLYLFFNDRLMEANVKKEQEPLREVRGLMVNLRDAWKQIEGQSPDGRSVPTGGGVNIAG
ncbi:flagellar protein FliS [Alkalispirochaeta sphaeroplastigenens]|uniref:Flagellar secretion chaperone FliS n=1 Tax=Alkalispirochaeta sphaeroplastigenens TaxID=1187066 RepID=A0A2S4JZ44_9SPIO|nr:MULTISPECIES: flagellar export chaperone FliS [Alkalispirochaeta]POR04792.1 flagellar protein FliS [Alkalispirochaeta sphaeroplastigenens]